MPAKQKKANDACAKKVKARYKVWPSAYALWCSRQMPQGRR